MQLAGAMHLTGAVTQRLTCRLAAAILAIQTIACGSTSVTQMTGPDSTRCQTTLSSVPTIPAGGGRLDVGVVAERECLWTAASNASWIQVSPTSGQGEASITLIAAANPQAATRTGNLVVNGGQFTVTQAPAPCTFTLSPSTVTMAAAGGSVGVHITSLAGCRWTTSSPATWVEVNPSSGTGSGDVTIGVDPNAGAARTATLSVAGGSLTVSQAAAPPAPTPAPGPTPTPSPGPAPPPPSPGPTPAPVPQPCTYSIDPLSRTVKSKGGDDSVKVNTQPGCAWTAVSNVSWVQVKDGGGTGTDSIKYEVDRNRTGDNRTATITVAGQLHIIVQLAND